MPPFDYLCERCPLNDGHDHRVLQRERLAHQMEIQAHRQAQDEADRLANLLTALVVTDDGADPRHETHSRLFSTRDDFQATVPEVPTTFAPIQTSQAIHSVEAVISQSLPLRPSAMRSRQQDQALLSETLQQIRAAHDDLDGQYTLNAQPGHLPTLLRALETATDITIRAGRLLESIESASTRKSSKKKSRAQDDAAFKALLKDVKTEGKVLDSLIDVAGHLVSTPESTDELRYDTGVSVSYPPNYAPTYDTTEHHFTNPIGHYDTVAQVMILLAVICHVIVGVATNPCNFILELVAIII